MEQAFVSFRPNSEVIKNAIREVQTMKQISHENVISMIDA